MCDPVKIVWCKRRLQRLMLGKIDFKKVKPIPETRLQIGNAVALELLTVISV